MICNNYLRASKRIGLVRPNYCVFLSLSKYLLDNTFRMLAITSEPKAGTGARKVAIGFGHFVLIALATFYNPCTAFGFFSSDNFILGRALYKLAAAGVNFDWVLELLGSAATGTDVGIQFGLGVVQEIGAVGHAICVCGCL
jgi:hypothetical protein